MKTYKIETHVHTAEVSPCGTISAPDIVKLYKDAGYDAVIITDHYSEGYYFNNLSNKTWEEKINHFLSGYRMAYKKGMEIGLNVILGIEICFRDYWKDYLIYGIDENFLYENPELYSYSIEEFVTRKKTKDMLIYQAHPYRNDIGIHAHGYIDGVEVYNGNPRHDSSNHLAYAYAKEHNLKMISGSDFHQLEDLGRSGIITSTNASNSKEFVRLLKNSHIVKLLMNSK